MATIPSPTDYQRQTPRSRMALTQENPGASEAANINLGTAIQKTGETIFRISDHLSSVEAEDAMNQLAIKDNERYSELSQIKGADANKGLLKTFTDRRAADVQAITEKMGNPFASEKFNGMVEKTAPRYGAVVVEHEIKERENYAKAVHLTGIETRAQTAAMAYGNDDRLKETLDSQMLSTSNRIKSQLGEPITDPTNPNYGNDINTRLAMVQADTGKIALAAIKGALTNGDSVRAEELMALHSKLMTQDQRDNAKEIIRPKADWNKGMGLLAQFEADVAGGMTTTEANNKARKSGEKEAYSIFKGLQTAKEQELREAEAEIVGGIMSGLYEAKSNSLVSAQKYFNDIQSTDDFRNLSGAARAKIRAQADTELTQGNAVTQQKLTITGMPLYQETRDNPNFITLTKGQINALRPEIGNTLVSQLLTEQQQLLSGAAQEKIDPKFINDAMTPEIFNNKDKSNAFRGWVTTEHIKWKERNPGKKLDESSQKDLISNAFKQMTRPGGGWFGMDTDVPAYMSVPDSMPPEVVKAIGSLGTDKEKIAFWQDIKQDMVKNKRSLPSDIPRAFEIFKKNKAVTK